MNRHTALCISPASVVSHCKLVSAYYYTIFIRDMLKACDACADMGQL